MRQLNIAVKDTPIVINSDLWLLKNPTNDELAELLGIKTPLKDTVYDLVIIGAGPVGLFAVFELGLLGLNCWLVPFVREQSLIDAIEV